MESTNSQDPDHRQETTDDSSNNVQEIRRIQSKAYDKITSEKGLENGLFRACMKAIRTGHVRSNQLRMGIVVAGMFTDRNMYREIITCFYGITAAAEQRMNELANDGDVICSKLQQYNFRRTKQYEADLQVLFDDDPKTNWQEHVQRILQKNPAAQQYTK
jgi:hypothetical protein